MAEEEENARGPFWTFFQENSPLFRELTEAKEMVAADKNNDKDFSNNRPVNSDCSSDNMNRHARQFRDVLREIDEICSGFIRNNGGSMATFFDICCAPGGFTKYVLEETLAYGMGVTLPVEQGGHPMIEELVSSHYTKRFHCVYQDIIDSPMDIRFTPPAAHRGDSALTSKEGCDFVIMGGMYQGNKPWLASQGLQAARQLALAEGREPPEEQPPKFTDHHIGFDALLVAQMIVALNNLAEGGTLMLTVNCNGNVINCSTICLLRCLFQRAHSAKVRVMHAHRGTFRMVFQGYTPAKEREYGVLDNLQTVLNTLKAETKVDSLSVPGVSDMSEMVEKFGVNVQRLYEPVWAVQLDALKRRFPGTFGLSASKDWGRQQGRSSRQQGRGPASSGSRPAGGPSTREGIDRHENGHHGRPSSDRWGRQEPGPSGVSGAPGEESGGGSRWGRGQPSDGRNGDHGDWRGAETRRPVYNGRDDNDGREGTADSHWPGGHAAGNGARKGSYVPPHARMAAERGRGSMSQSNKNAQNRW